MDIATETLDAIRSELPNGSQIKIAKKTKYSEQYVSHVLNGKVELNANNMTIISEAKKIIMEFRKQKEDLKKDLNQLRSK